MVNVTALVFFLDRQKAYMHTKVHNTWSYAGDQQWGKRMDQNQR